MILPWVARKFTVWMYYYGCRTLVKFHSNIINCYHFSKHTWQRKTIAYAVTLSMVPKIATFVRLFLFGYNTALADNLKSNNSVLFGTERSLQSNQKSFRINFVRRWKQCAISYTIISLCSFCSSDQSEDVH